MDRTLIRNNPEAVDDKTLLMADAEQGLVDLYHFDKYILGYAEMEDHVHRPLCEFVKGGKNKKLIMMPRGSFKSSVITVGMCIQEMVLHPDIRILIANEKLSNAQKFLGEIKGHLTQNEYFRMLYGQLDNTKDETVWNQSEIVISTRKKVFKEPTISTAGVDVTKVSQHYDLIIVDDPVSHNNVTTKDQIDKVLDWYKGLLSLLDPGGRIIIIGTRWDYGDLYGTLLEEPHKSMFDFYIKRAEWMDDNGEIQYLFPERLTRQFLDEIKRAQGTYFYSCQYLNEPVAAADATFKPNWFRYYIDDDLKNVDLLYFLTLDPAISLEQSADFTVFNICAIDSSNNLYIIKIDRGKYLPDQIIKKLFEYNKIYNISMNGIEVVAFQKTLRYQINDMMRATGHFINIAELKHDNRQSKESRIRGLQPRYEQGTIFHRQGDDLTPELEHELLHFPKSKHDDIIDTLASHLEILYTPIKKEKTKKKKRSLSKNKYVKW